MQIRIKSGQLIQYLEMGWTLLEMAYNSEECWLVMDGSLKSRILEDLGLVERDIQDKEKIFGTGVTRRMLCCWYARERFGLTIAKTAMLFGVSSQTVSNAHKKVSRVVKSLDLPDAAKKIGGIAPPR